MESSSSSMAISQMVIISSHWVLSFSYFSSLFFSALMRFCTFWLFSVSFQKPSCALSSSSFSTSLRASSSLSAAPRSASGWRRPLSLFL